MIHRRNQHGLTLVELLVSLPLIGLISAAAAGAIIQTIRSHDINTGMMAVRQVQAAGGWISRDGVQAQRIQIADNVSSPNGFPVTLSWGQGYWDGETGRYHTECRDVIYFLEDSASGDRQVLRRREMVTGSRVSDGTCTVAYYVDGAATTCLRQPGERNAFVFTITVNVGGDIESRRYQVQPRPGPLG